MANLITSNNAVGSLDGDLSSNATNIVLNNITNFPVLTDPEDYCVLTLIRSSDGALEYVKCTSQNITNRSYSVIRGQEGTTPLSYLDGAEVRNLLTESQISFITDSIDDLESDLTTLEGTVTTIGSDLTTLEGTVATVGSDLTTLEGTVTAIGSDLTTLEGTVTTIESDLTTVEGTVTDLVDRLNPNIHDMRYLGCDPTGVADCSPTLVALLLGNSFTNGDIIYFPKGSYRFNSPVNILAKGFIIKGDGINSTNIIINNTTGWVSAETTDDNNPEYTEWRGLTVTTTTNTEWAIKIIGTGNVLDERNSPRINIIDIEINCEAVNTSFAKAIFLNNTMHATISRVHGKGYWTGTSASITSGSMIFINGTSSPVEFHISDCWSFFFETAVQAVDKVEGLLIDKLQAIAVNSGVVWNTSEPKPQLTLTNSHISAYSRSLQLVNLAQGNIQGNLLYKRTESTLNWKGIDCNTVRDTTILNNVFGDTSTTALGTANAIELTASTNNNISMNRMFNLDKGVFTDSTSLDNSITFNDSIGTTTDLDLNETNATAVSNKLGSTTFKGYISDEDNDVLKFRPLNGVNMGLEIGADELGGIKYIDFITEGGFDYNARIEVAGGSSTQASGDMTFDASSYTFLNSGIDATGAYNNISDERLKDNIEPISYDLNTLLKLNPKQYNMRDVQLDDGKTLSKDQGLTLGLLAQEVEDVLPEVVSTGRHGYKQIAYSTIVPLLIQAIKDLNTKVDSLQK